MNAEKRCVFTEGSVALPAGAAEQTINIIVAEGTHNITLSRDNIPAGSSFDGYVLSQIEQLKSKFQGVEVHDRQPVSVSEGAIVGVALTVSFLANPTTKAWQYIVLFAISSERVMILSTLCASDEAVQKERQRIDACASSFRLADA